MRCRPIAQKTPSRRCLRPIWWLACLWGLTALLSLPQTAAAGTNAGATFAVSPPTLEAGIGAGDTVRVTVSAVGLVDVTQFEVVMHLEPADAFVLEATQFAPGPAFDSSAPVSLRGPTGQVVGAASLRSGATVSGAGELGTFTLVRSAAYPELTAGGTSGGRARLIRASLGPTAADRDVFVLADLRLACVLNPAWWYGAISPAVGNGEWTHPVDNHLATQTGLLHPTGIAFAPDGSLLGGYDGNYLVWYGTGNVYRVDPVDETMRVLTWEGVAGDYAQLPVGVAVGRDGSVFYTDRRHRVLCITPGELYSTRVAGAAEGPGYVGDGGPATEAKLNDPRGIAVDPDGNVVVVDAGNHRVRRVTLATGRIETIAGGGIVLGDGGNAAAANLLWPTGVAADSAGNLYVGDTGNQRVRRIDRFTGVITTVAGNGLAGFSGDGGPATLARLQAPAGVAVGHGHLYIADEGNARVRAVDLRTGRITTVAGGGSGNGDWGPATRVALSAPRWVAVDAYGDVYVSEFGGPRVRRIHLAVPWNRPPVLATLTDRAVAAGDSLTLTLAAADEEGDTLSFSVSPMPAGARLANGCFGWRPTLADVGTDTLVVTVSDGHGGTDQQAVVIRVTARDEAWSTQLRVANGGGAWTVLQFGQAQGATDDVDAVLDEEALPPLPVTEAFDARWITPLGEGVALDLRSLSARVQTWCLHVQAGDGGYPVTLAWEPSRLPGTGAIRLQDTNPYQTLIDVDMRAQASCQVWETTQLQVFHGQAIERLLPAGWSLVSRPLTVADSSLLAYTSNPQSLFGFTSGTGYVDASVLELGRGYWLKLREGQRVRVDGEPPTSLSMALPRGWSLVGPGAQTLDVAGLKSTYPDIVSVYGYAATGGYYQPPNLQPGHGYWIYLSAPGTVDLNGSVAPWAGKPVLSADDGQGALLRIESREGSQLLPLGTGDEVLTPAPPVPPAEALDARVDLGDRMVFGVPASAGAGPFAVRVQGPATHVSWQVPATAAGQWQLQVGDQAVTLTGQGRLPLVTGTQVHVRRLASTALALALAPNYPNPFNGATLIPFAVPTPAQVRLSVFTLTGQRVADLANGHHAAGRFEVAWNGQDLSGHPVASGVYLYRLELGSEVLTRKLLLLR